MSGSRRQTVIFDLGGVLIEWDPPHLYRRLFDGDEAAMEAFLTEVCTTDWNRAQDAGRTFAEAEAEAIARHPDKQHLIEAWYRDFHEMIPGAISRTVEILDDLRRRGVPLFALTNWSAETFASQAPRFEFLDWFEGILVSGRERMIKPDPRIFQLLMDRHGIAAEQAVFIDDSLANVEAANALGIHGIHFTSPTKLRRELSRLSLL
jgi:2-haloacid dehalogenase